MHLNSTVLNSGGMRHKNRLSPYNEGVTDGLPFLLLVFCTRSLRQSGTGYIERQVQNLLLSRGNGLPGISEACYTLKNDRKNLDNRILQIRNERDLFLFNTHLQLAEEDGTSKSSQQMKKTRRLSDYGRTSGGLPRPK